MAIRDRDQALQALFAAKRSGGGNIYGGPPQPQQPQQPQAQQPQAYSGGGADSILSQMGDRKPKEPDTGLNPFSSGFGTSLKNGLGTVLGGAVKALEPVSNIGVLGAEHLIEGMNGREFAGQTDDYGNVTDKRSNWEKLNDPNYGVGELLGDGTGNKWVDRTIGFLGDVALDPLTYVSGGATKSVAAVGKTGRSALAQKAARLGMSDDVIRSVSKYGPAFQPDDVRKALNVKDAGIYWGIGEASVKLPGTTILGRGAEKSFAQIRDKSFGNLNKLKKARGADGLQAARRATQSGRTIDGWTPALGAKFLNNVDVREAAKAELVDVYSREAQQMMKGWDDRVRKGIMHEVEGAPELADGSLDITSLTPQAQQWVGLRDKLKKLADDNGVNIGDLGSNYVPHRYTPESFKFFRDKPQAQALMQNLTEGKAATKARAILPGSTHVVDDVTLKFGDASLRNIEEVFQAAFPDSGVKQFVQDNGAAVMERYIDEISESVATVQMIKGAIASGDIGDLKAYSDEMVASASTATRNRETKLLLDQELARRDKELGALQKESFELQRQVADALHDSVEETLRKTGDERKFLQNDIKEIFDDIQSAKDRTVIQKKFIQMKERANRAYGDTVAELEANDESLNALELAMSGRDYGQGIGIQRSAVEEADQLRRISLLERQREGLEESLAEYGDAVSAANHLEDMIGARIAAAEQIEELAGSPQMLREFMDELAADEVITKQVPVYGPREKFVSPRVEAYRKKMEELQTQEAADELVEGLSVEAKSLAWRGDADAAAEALDSVAVARLAQIKDLRAQQDVIKKLHVKAKEAGGGRVAMTDFDAAAVKELQSGAKKIRMRLVGKQNAATKSRTKAQDVWRVDIRQQGADNVAAKIKSFDAAYQEIDDAGRVVGANLKRDALDVQVADLDLQMAQWEERIFDAEQRLSASALKMLKSDNATDVTSDLYAKASIAAAEVKVAKDELADLSAQIAKLSRDPYDIEVRRMQAEINQKVSGVANARSSASWMRNASMPKTTSSKDMAGILRDIEKIEGHDRWIAKIIDGEFETITTTSRRVHSTTPQLEEDIVALTQQLAEVEAAELAVPQIPDLIKNFKGNRQDLLTRVSDEEADVVMGYLGRLQAGSKRLQAEADAAMYARKKRFPNYVDADAQYSRTTQSVARDTGKEFDAMDLRRGELEAKRAKGGMTQGEYRELDAMPLRKSKVWDDAAYAEADGVSDALRMSDNDYSFEFATEAPTMESAGAQAQREAKRLQADADKARAAYNQAKKSLGVSDADMRAAAPGGNIGSVIQFDSGYAARGKGDWVGSIMETPEGLRQAAFEKFGGNWVKASKAFPQYAKKGSFDKLSHVEAAVMLGGRARMKRAGSAALAKLDQEAVASQSRSAMRSVIRKMPPHQRRRLWIEARDMAGQSKNRAMVERQMIERQLRDKSGELLSQMDEAAKLRSAASAERGVAAGLQRQVDDSVGGALADVQAASTAVRVGEREVADVDAAARALDAKWQATADVRETAEVALRKELKDDSARLAANASRIDAVRNEVGDKAARELVEFDQARAALKKTLPAKEARVADLTERVEELRTAKRKLKAAKKDKLGPRKGIDDQMLERRYDEYGVLLRDALDNPDDLNAVAAADLYDQWMKLNTKMDRLRQGGDDLMEVYEAASLGAKGKAGGLALDMQQGLVDGFARFRSNLYPAAEGLPIDNELNRVMTNFLKATNDDMQLKWLDAGTKFFKSYATATPGFHIRNFMGATFMNFSDGVSSKNTVKALKLWRGYADDPENFIKGQPKEVQEAFRAVFGVGAGGSFEAGEIGSGLSRAKNLATSNSFLRKSRKIGEDWVEGPVRLAAALDTTLKGGDFHDAMARTAKLHFNYGDLSTLDKRMKRLIPFWVFMSRNLPLQVEQMWRKPKAYAVYNHFMNNISIEGEEDEFMPKWMKESGGVVIGRDGIFGQGKDTVLLPDMQHTGLQGDIEAWGGGDGRWPILDGLLSAGNPMVAKPVEMLANRSGFRGGDLFFDTKKNENGVRVQKDMGDKALERFMYGLEGMFTASGSVQGLAGFDVQGGEASARAADRQGQKALNFMGLPFKQLGEKERRAEALRRQFEDA